MSTPMAETTSAPSLREETRVVPLMPTEAMWGGLARQIVMWSRQNRATGANLHRDLKNVGWLIPDWLGDEIEDADYVPPKGSVAVAIYRAMVEAAPPTTQTEAVASARAEGVREGLERAAGIADDWLKVWGSREPKHVSAQSWANGAVGDIAEVIREQIPTPPTTPGGRTDG